MKVWNWKELAAFACERSPFYRNLYGELGEEGIAGLSCLSELPPVDQDAFWQANTVCGNQVFTGKACDGIVFKSGGTTGNPKFSVYTREEWQLFCRFFGEGMQQSGLEDGDRLANLFYVGELYASFIFIMKCVEAAPVAALQFPIAGSTDPEICLKTIAEFQINVLAGLPTTLMTIAEHYASNSSKFGKLNVSKIFFGGESMFPDQRQRLSEIFANPSIRSIGYASVDAGLLGYADSSCAADEHRSFGTATVFEIVDEKTFQPISEPGISGKVLISNLIRAYMPIIRYPAGDLAVWSEPASAAKNGVDRKFRIIGRSEEAARVGPVSVYYEDMRNFLDSLEIELPFSGFQLLISHFELKDALTLRLIGAEPPEQRLELEFLIQERFGLARRMFAEAVAADKIHPLKVEWVKAGDAEVNQRTGKLKRVIDRRLG